MSFVTFHKERNKRPRKKGMVIKMNYNLTQFTFPSTDGKNTIYAEIYAPRAKTVRGIVQVVHGMTDYTGRYTLLADYLAKNGYILAGNHHLGHGKSVAKEEDFGYFAERDGVDYVVDDMKKMNDILHKEFPTLPIIIFGHSMGSFMTRLYVAKYPLSVKGAVIHGTGGKNPLVGIGIALAKLVRMFRGGHHRSRLITKLALGNYNSKFPKEEGKGAWLTRDIELIAPSLEDKFSSFTFTTSGYIDLFTSLRDSNSKKWYKTYPKELPTLIMSGDMDPVGNYGRGPAEVYKKLTVGGATSVELKLYPGARHELFNETNRTEVFTDLVAWLDGVIK